MFDKLSVRFNGRVIFVKDVIGGNEEICCWSFYGHSRKVGEISCTSIMYTSEKKQTKVSGSKGKRGHVDCQSSRGVSLAQWFLSLSFTYVDPGLIHTRF